MSDITAEQRRRILDRDRQRCLRCGKFPATLQHRRAKGMGGLPLGPRGTVLTCADGLALCANCNVNAEGVWQIESLEHGWKIRRNCPIPATEIPYYDRLTGNWWLPDEVGGRQWIAEQEARERIDRALA